MLRDQVATLAPLNRVHNIFLEGAPSVAALVTVVFNGCY